MLTFRDHRHNAVTDDLPTRVAIVGDYYRRAYVKHILGNRVSIVGELVSDRKVHLLSEVEPDIVFLDCGSKGMNPFLSLPQLRALQGSPLVIAFAPPASTSTWTAEALMEHGADRVITIGDTRALASLIGCVERAIDKRQCTSLSPVAA